MEESPPAPPAEAEPSEQSLEQQAPPPPGSPEVTGGAPRRGWLYGRAARWCGVVLVCLLASLAMSFPYFIHGAGSYVVVGDTANITVPSRVWFQARGISPFGHSWDPQGESGTDALAGALPGDVLTVAFRLAPGWLAYGLILWAQRFIAVLGMYLLLRAFRCRRPLAFGLALLYAVLCRPALTQSAWQGFALWDGFALCGLPLLIWFLVRTGRWRARWAYPAALACGLLLGFSSPFFLTVFALPLVLISVPLLRPRGWRPWLTVAAAVGGWALVAAPTIWAAAANAPASHRASWDALVPWLDVWSSDRRGLWWLLATVAVPLGLAVAGVAIGIVRRQRRVLLLGAALVVWIGLYAALPALRQHVLDHLGFLGGFGWERVSSGVPFLAVVTAGAGLALLPSLRLAWPRRQRTVSLPEQVFVGVLAGVMALVITVRVDARAEGDRSRGQQYATYFERPEMKALGRRADAGAQPFRVATVYAYLSRDHDRLTEPGYAWAYGLETADGFSPLYPRSYKEFWLAVFQKSLGNTAQPTTIFAKSGNQVRLYTATFNLRRQEGILADRRWRMPLLDLANVSYLISPVRLRGPGLVPLELDASGRQLVSQQLAAGQFARAAGPTPRGGQQLYIYENRSALPRAFLAPRRRVLAGAPQVLAALRAATLADVTSTVYLTAADAAALPPAASASAPSAPASATPTTPAPAPAAPAGTASVVPAESSSDVLSVSVAAAEPCLLVVSVNYSPYWRATVDGRSAPLVRADHTFMAVPVGSGAHSLQLRYLPPYHWWPH